MKTIPSQPRRNVPETFLKKFGAHVTGALSGFDRLRLRGTLRLLFAPQNFEIYLQRCKVLMKNFTPFVRGLTERVRKSAYERFEREQRPFQYLRKASISKEDLAREIAERDGISEGPIALFSAVEPCLSYAVRSDHRSKEIHMVLETRRCTHLYFYHMHPSFGLMHFRLQTWFPFTVDICLNGREWLSRQMDQQGIGYRQEENCFVWIEDVAKAQVLLDEQLKQDWPKALNALVADFHPLHREIVAPIPALDYYWSASQSEYATDVMFEPKELERLRERFLRHSIENFSCKDVLRFLGRKVLTKDGVRSRFVQDTTSSYKQRPEGVRLRHTVGGNSLKMYDKQACILRVETTIVHPNHFKVYRPKEGGEDKDKQWRPLRRGTADLHRRAEVSDAANQRYLAALASVTGSTPLKEEAKAVCRRIKKNGQSYRALNPLSVEDSRLLEAISKGETLLNGFRNRDLRESLFSPTKSAKEQRRRSAAITRKLALLRAHGLIKKVPTTHRYHLTDHGRRIVTALLIALKADVDQLTKLAA
jgi:hypothetical protein